MKDETTASRTTTSPRRFLTALLIAGTALALGNPSAKAGGSGGGGSGSGPVYPKHLSIDMPVLKVVGLEESAGDEPYFVAFSWEATSKDAGADKNGSVVPYTRELASRTPDTVFIHARAQEEILLGEHVSNAVFDFPEVPSTLSAATNMHVKIAGHTICAFEQDTGLQKTNVTNDILAPGPADSFLSTLETALQPYTEQPYSDANLVSAFESVFDGMKSKAERIHATLTREQQQQGGDDLLNTIVNQLDSISTKAVDPSKILEYIGGGIRVIETIVRLIRKKNAPDDDDFVGCSTVVTIGVPGSLLTSAQCYDNQVQAIAADVIVCPIEGPASGESQLAFRLDVNEKGDAITPNATYVGDVFFRAGQFRPSSGYAVKRGIDHSYGSINDGPLGMNYSMPDVRFDNPVCTGNSGHGAICDMHFAHVVNYQTLGADMVSFAISETQGPSPGQIDYNLRTWGDGGPYANVGVRFSTVTIPAYIKWERDVIDLVASPSTAVYGYSYRPSGWSDSNLITIIEILEWEEVNAGASFYVHAEERPLDKAVEIKLGGPGNGYQCIPFQSPCQTRATVRVTYLSWEPGDPVVVSESTVLSSVGASPDKHSPEILPWSWSADPLLASSGGVLYFVTKFNSAGDHNAGFTIRATGTEVPKGTDWFSTLYVQDFYDENVNSSVEAKMINFRFDIGN